MMMNETLEAAFNKQLTLEFASHTRYLQMSAWFSGQSFPGFAHWMRLQADEERMHAMKIYDYLLTRGNLVRLEEMAAPPFRFEKPLSVFEAALDHERAVSESIRNLYGLATKEQDYASFQLLQWFLTEQIEEEELVSQIVDQLRLVGDDGPALLMLDRELGSRSSTSSSSD